MLHAHLTTESSDCDGRYSRESIREIETSELRDEFGDITFKQRILGTLLSIYQKGTLDVTPDGAEWNQPTDEGHINVLVEWCDDPECSPPKYGFRDHSAEAAGY